jgi:class 3 adenylate cyclase/tetratricopeptide (TPR) repeat protein
VICEQCATTNETGRKFCRECGTRLLVACASCGTANPADAKFCGECGLGLETLPVAATASVARAEPPARSRPDGAGSAANGATAERRLVSILFADLVGFTPFAEERDAEHVRGVLSRYFEAARTVIERHGGRVEKFIGDAVMAVWGTPTAYEDDAERAVRAALELLPAVRMVDLNLAARAAVMTGEAAVDPHAADQAMVAGDLVNAAARLQAAAQPDTVLVAESTMRAAESAIVFEAAGNQHVKGKSLPISAWRAIRVVAERRGRHRAEALEPPFVGRASELQLLKELLHATTREHRPRLVAVTGPGGIGKSRLAWELEKYVDGLVEPVFWHRGRSPSYGEGVSFWALGEMVRQRANLAETDNPDETRTRIAATVAEYVDAQDRPWIEGALLALLGLEAAPAGGRDVLFAAWRTFFERIARRGTTVLLFEDLQWADAGLLDFIDHLLEWAKGVPLLVLALARPELFENHPDFARAGRQFASMPLGPLSDDEIRELLEGMAPGLPDDAAVAIVHRADGVPLYAVETIRMLIAESRLELVDDRYAPRGRLDNLDVPSSLRSLIRARLDTLDSVDRALLEKAAVLGQVFTVGGLSAVSGIDADELVARLRALVRREIVSLNDDPRSPERGQYQFVQSMIREVAYGTLSRRDRRELHLAAARYYEGLGNDELAGALASHYLAAYELSEPGAEADAVGIQARLAFRGAAERSRGLGAYAQAASFLRQALEVATAPRDRGELHALAAEALLLDGRYAAALESATTAAAAFKEAGDTESLARALGIRGTAFLSMWRIDDAIESLEEATGVVPGGTTEFAELSGRLARAYMRADRIDDAVAAADRALAIAEAHDMTAVIADGLNNKASAIDRVGRTREAVILLEGALKLSLETDDIELQLRIRNNLASSCGQIDHKRSSALLREGIELARKLGLRPQMVFQINHFASIAYATGDDWPGTVALVETALETAADDADRVLLVARLLGFAFAQRETDASDIARWDAVADPANPDQVAWRSVLLGIAVLGEDNGASYEGLMRGVDSQWYDPWVAEWALRAALWVGDADRAAVALGYLHKDPATGPWTESRRVWTRAVEATFDKRPQDAAKGFLEAHRRYSALGLRFFAAMVGLDAAIAFPNEPALRSLVASSNEALKQIGAHAYARLLERARESAGDPASTQAAAEGRKADGARQADVLH